MGNQHWIGKGEILKNCEMSYFCGHVSTHFVNDCMCIMRYEMLHCITLFIQRCQFCILNCKDNRYTCLEVLRTKMVRSFAQFMK